MTRPLIPSAPTPWPRPQLAVLRASWLKALRLVVVAAGSAAGFVLRRRPDRGVQDQVTRFVLVVALLLGPRRRLAVLRASWSKALRLVVVAAGSAAGFVLRRRPDGGALLTIALNKRTAACFVS